MNKISGVGGLLLAALLSACSGDIAQLTQIGTPAAPPIEQKTNGESTEIILHPVAVWEEANAAASQQVSVDGHVVKVRRRSGDFWDKAFVRAGLFWHSRKNNIFVPVVVLGPPVKIRQVEIRAGNRVSLLRRAANFKFTPSGSQLAKDKQSSAAFEMKPEMLAQIVTGETAHMVVRTNRGNLHLGLDVVNGDSPSVVRGNARYLFSRFSEKMAQVKENG